MKRHALCHGTEIMCDSVVPQEAEYKLVMQQIFIKGWKTAHFRSLAINIWTAAEVSCIGESGLHYWLQLVNGNMFVMRGKLDLDNSYGILSSQVHLAI